MCPVCVLVLSPFTLQDGTSTTVLLTTFEYVRWAASQSRVSVTDLSFEVLHEGFTLSEQVT